MLQHPLGGHFSKAQIYIGGSYNNKIKVLDMKTQNVITVELLADSIEVLWKPAGVLELNNRLYVSGTKNHRIQKIDIETGKIEIFIV